MASPPSVTLSAINATTSVPAPSTYHKWDAAGKFNLTNGDWLVSGTSYPDTISGKGLTITASPTIVSGLASAVEFNFTGRYLEPHLKGKGHNWRMLVWDAGNYDVPPEVVSLPYITSSGTWRVLIDFGTVVNKIIRFEQTGGGEFYFYGLTVQNTATVTATAAITEKLVLFGDSHLGGSGNSTLASSVAIMLAHKTGFRDFRVSPSGGTGWVNNGGGSLYNATQRFPFDVTNRSPNMAILWVGANDIGRGTDALVGTNFAASLDALQAANPNCVVHVFSPPDTGAPGLSQTGYDALSTVLQNGCAGRTNVHYHSLKGIAFTKADGAHANDAGSLVLYREMFNMIAAVHGLTPIP